MKNPKKALASLLLSYLLIVAGWPLPVQAQQGTAASYVAGERVVSWYNFGKGGVLGAYIANGNTGTGSQTITVCPALRALPDGRQVNLFGGQPGSAVVPITVDAQSSTNAETVTPTAVSLTGPQFVQGSNQAVPCANITASFTYTHPASLNTHQVISGDGGLQEAINDAFQGGGGMVTVGADSAASVTNAIIAAAIPLANVTISDKRFGGPRYWNPTPTGANLAAPTAPAASVTGQLACDATHQMCSDATVAGSASWGGAVYACWAYVDIMGNEGPCSATTNWTSAASKAIDLGIPAASPGAVGAVPYLSLSGGTYAQAYRILPTAAICTLTKLETTTPACAVANATYGQSASTFGAGGLFTSGGAQITGYPVNTSPHFTGLNSTVQTTASWVPQSNSSVSYAYAPSNRVGLPGISSANIAAYPAAPSTTTGIPNSIATWTIPAGYFNYVGAEFRVSGKMTYTDGGAAITQHVYVKWDSEGTNSTTVPTTLCDMLDGATTAGAAQNVTYTCTIRIITTGASGTALVNGMSVRTLAAGATTLVGTTNDIGTAATSAINLTAPARIAVFFVNTGATDNPGAQGLQATLEALN